MDRRDQRGGRSTDERRPVRTGGRLPPHHLQAEESVLGALLLSRDAIGAVSEQGLRPDDFYKPGHQHVFDAIRALYSTGAPADTITVADELRKGGLLEQIGGLEALHALQNATPAISNAAHYARIVQDTAMLRRLIHVAGDIAELAYGEPDDVTKAVDEAESKVFKVAEERIADSTMVLSESIKGVMDRLEETFARGDIITGTATGYHDIDELLSGLQPSTLTIVGARPAMGKTGFGLGIATHVAQSTGRPVLFFSLEMGHHELTQRILSSEARVDSTLIRNGRLSESDWAKIGRAIGRLEVPLFLDDNPRVTVMEIRAKARRMKARHGALALIVIDYLQLMQGGGNPENRQLEVSDISRNLKILARELEVPIVALSQLSRNLESRGDKRPMLADLRESGCLTASTRLVRADTGAEVELGALVGSTDVPVWSLDEHYRLVPARLVRAFPSGVKDTFRLRLASGRQIDASANHPFLTVGGWRPLEALAPGDYLAAARRNGAAPVVDQIPAAVWEHVRTKALPAAGLSMFDLAEALDLRYCRATLERFRLTRERVARIAAVTGDDWLGDLATADVVWDRVMAITPLGGQPVFDATIETTHNFVADGIVAHNSLEQDADVVMFLYRDEVYNQESPDKGSAEVIVAKHRSGPIGVKRLVFLGQYTRFDNAARGV
ncbi:MAG: replicative DNA helicase [Ilumatobacteraceae bacterium]